MKIVVFGDSITAGYERRGAANVVSPILKLELERAFGQRGASAEVLLRGVCGEDSSEAMARFSQIVAEQADVTVIFFGANDAAASHAIDPATFYKNLQIFVENLGQERVLLLTPPYHNDAVSLAPRNNELVEQFRQSVLQLVSDFAVPCLDLYDEMRRKAQPAELLQSDGLHFSKKGYQFLADMLAEKLFKLA